MAVKLVVAVTDTDWFNLLRRQELLTEVNFWAPSVTNFRALQPGELFLFKLHAPVNKIVGGGVFAYATTLPLSLARESRFACAFLRASWRHWPCRRERPIDRTQARWLGTMGMSTKGNRPPKDRPPACGATLITIRCRTHVL